MYSIPTFRRFQWINNPIVIRILTHLLQPAHTGRKGYGKALLFRWLMYKQLMRCSYRDIESMSGIHHTTFVKFRKQLITTQWLTRSYKKLSGIYAPLLPCITALLDSSFIETYSKHDERGSGYSGYKEKNGFKLHSIIDFDTRLPLTQMITPGNIADITAGKSLVERAPPAWRVRGFSADKGYDSQYFIMDIKQKWKNAFVAIPVRKIRQSGDPTNNIHIKRKDRSYDQSLYKKRTEVERYFSRKKRVFNLGCERTRGLKNFRANCTFTSIMEILEWSTTPA